MAFHLAFSPDGERIAIGKGGSGDIPGAIAVHSTRDGNKLLGWDSPLVSKLEFSPDGGKLLQVTRNEQINLWDAASGTRLWTYRPSKARALRAGFTPDGHHVLAITGSVGPDSFVLLNVANGRESRTFGMGINSIDAFAIRPDGQMVLWGDSKGYVHAADLSEGRLLFSNRAHNAPVRHAAFTPDGERFVSISSLPDGRHSIRVSNAKTGAALQTLLGGTGTVRGIAIHPLSGELLVASQSSRVWDLTGTAPIWSMRSSGEGSPCGGAAFLGSDEIFLGPQSGFRTVLQHLRDSSVLWKSPSAGYYFPSISADGGFIALANPKAADASLQVVRHEAGRLFPLSEFTVRSALVALQLNPAGDRLAIAARMAGKRLAIFDASTGKELAPIEQKSLQEITDIAWLDRGTKIVGLAAAYQPRGVAKSEERIIVWDAATRQRVRSLVHPTALDCLAVAPDGKSFAAAGADNLVHVFDTETLAERQAFRAHDGPITALAWHPARPIVATGSADLTNKLWNLDTGRRLETLRGPTAAPRVLIFSPSGQRLACASEDRMVRIWEPKPLNNAVLDAPATAGWEDLLAKLKADEVKANGNGWTLSGGVLMSPDKRFATVPLGASFERSSYTLKTTVRRLKEKDLFAVILPIGDQQVAFVLDSDPASGFATGLSTVDSKRVLEAPSATRGPQIRDSEPHELEITVRLSARTVEVSANLDGTRIFEWSGAVTSLQVSGVWPPLPQPTLYLGASGANWVVSAVKVKRQ